MANFLIDQATWAGDVCKTEKDYELCSVVCIFFSHAAVGAQKHLLTTGSQDCEGKLPISCVRCLGNFLHALCEYLNIIFRIDSPLLNRFQQRICAILSLELF